MGITTIYSPRPKKPSAKAIWVNTRLEYAPDGTILRSEGFWYVGPWVRAGGANSRSNNWAFYADGSESASVIINAINTNPAKGDLVNDTIYLFRIAIEEDATGNLMNFSPQLTYNHNGGGDTDVNAASSVIRSAGSGSGLTDGNDTTDRITAGDFTFDGTNEGQDEIDGVAGGGSADLSASGAEFLWAFIIRDGDVSDGDTIVFNVYEATGGAPLDDYDHTLPTITVEKAGTDVTVVSPLKEYAFAGLFPDIGTGVIVVAPLKEYVFAGLFPEVAAGASAAPPLKEYVFAGLIPEVLTGVTVVVPLKEYVFAGPIPEVATGVTVVSPLKTFTFAGLEPEIFTGVTVESLLKTFTFTGLAPEIVADTSVGVPPRAFTFTGLAPEVLTGVTLDVPLGTFVFAGLLPDIATGVLAVAPLKAYAFADFIPTVASGAGPDVPLGIFTFASVAPAVASGAGIDVPLGAFTFAGFIPSIDAGAGDEALGHRKSMTVGLT